MSVKRVIAVHAKVFHTHADSLCGTTVSPLPNRGVKSSQLCDASIAYKT